MRDECECHRLHLRRRIVLTGGPGAGKTAVLELVRQSLCRHVTILPEAAGIVFGGGFPRNHVVGVRRAAQRAIYFVQQELEAAAAAAEARAIDDRIIRAWEGHPRRYVVDASSDFLTKANQALEILHDELPGCCRTEVLQTLFETATERASQNA